MQGTTPSDLPSTTEAEGRLEPRELARRLGSVTLSLRDQLYELQEILVALQQLPSPKSPATASGTACRGRVDG